MTRVNRLWLLFLLSIILFTACSQEKAENSELVFQEGLTSYKAGDLNNAVRQFHQVVSLEPESAGYRFAYAMALRDLNKPNEAIAQLNQSIQLDPQYAAAVYLLNDLYRETHQLAAGIEFWESQLQQNPNCWLYYGCGELQYYRNDATAAGQMMDQAIALNPDYALAYTVKGLIELNQNRLPEAAENFKQAVAGNTSYCQGYYYLSYIYYKMGEPAESEKYYQIAKRWIPELPPVSTLSDTAETVSYSTTASVSDKLIMRVNYKDGNDEPKLLIRIVEYNFGDKKLNIFPLQNPFKTSQTQQNGQLPTPSRYNNYLPLKQKTPMPVKIPLDSTYTVNFFKDNILTIHELLSLKIIPLPIDNSQPQRFQLHASSYTPLFNQTREEQFESIPLDSTIVVNGNKQIHLKEMENLRIICDIMLAGE